MLIVRGLFCLVLSVGSMLIGEGVASEEEATSVENSFYTAVIYLPANPAREEEEAADLLKESWRRLTRYDPEIRRGGSPRIRSGGRLKTLGRYFYGWEFSIGETAWNRKWVPAPSTKDPEAFAYRAERFLVGFKGNHAQGTYLAVSRFIQEVLGIYWIYPGEGGWVLDRIPPRQGVNMIRYGQPGYLSRTMFGLGKEDQLWRKRNGVFSRFAFHHNLYRIFNEEAFQKHPEFFPWVGGERIPPQDTLRGLNAQITFSNPEAAEYAGEKITEYFKENPHATSYSLGINDTRIFSEEDEALWEKEKKVFRNVQDFSNLIFGFMNRVAEVVSLYRKDLYVGCLAYYIAENVPDFPVHPQVIPYLTADRNLYWDPGFRSEDEQLQERWNRSGVRYWGTYDYYYGGPYDQIRDYHQTLPLTAVGAFKRGARGATSEINPRWGLNLPLPWVLAQLWWDPQQDAEALYDRFYRMAFGNAAVSIRRFYNKGEEVWLRQRGRTFWLRNYFHPLQWEWWQEEDFEELSILLQQAEKEIQQEPLNIRKRWKIVNHEFQQLRAGWNYFSLLKKLSAQGRFPTEEEARYAVRMLTIANGLEVVDSLPDITRFHQVSAQGFLENGASARPSDSEGSYLKNKYLSGELEAVNFPEKLTPLALVHPRMQRRPEYRLMSALLASHSISLKKTTKIDLRGLGWTLEFRECLREWDRLLPDPLWKPFLAIEERQNQEIGKEIPFKGPWYPWKRPGGEEEMEYRESESSWNIRKAAEVRIYGVWPAKAGAVYQVSAEIEGKITEGSRIELQAYFRDGQGRRLQGKEGRAKIYYLLPGEHQQESPARYVIQAPSHAKEILIQQVVIEQGEQDWVEFRDLNVTEWDTEK